MSNWKKLVAGALFLLLVLFVMSIKQTSPFAPNSILSLAGFWSINPIKTPQLYSIALQGVYPQNTSFINQSITVNVDTVIPAQYLSNKWNYTTTKVTLTYCSWYVFQNSTQKIILNGTLTNMTNTTYTATFVFTPRQTGVYAIGDVCESSSTIYNASTNSWSTWSTPSVIAQDERIIKVVVPVSFSPPAKLQISISNFFNNIINSIINAIESFLKIFNIFRV